MKAKDSKWKNNKILYIGLVILVLGIGFAVGTYAYYQNTLDGTASGTTLGYTCEGNGGTSFVIDDITGLYPGSSEVRNISLTASIYSTATIEVTGYSNMNDSVRPNLALYNDSGHENKMLADGTNAISTEIYPGVPTTIPIYVYWSYGNAIENYSETTPSASIKITCSQSVSTCQRVTSVSDLHTETCTNSSTSQFCQADGYALNGTITYGTIWDGSSALKAGDAFDCDVNDNGKIDRDANGNSTERFYYVSDKWNEGTNKNSFDTSTAVLVYYRNYKNGAAGDNGAAYATQAQAQNLGYECNKSDGCNWYGPIGAVTSLPKTTGSNAWRADLLTDRVRTMYACNNQNCDTIGTTTGNGVNQVVTFDYGATTAARLLALPEIVKGCRGVNGNASLANTGSLKACNFLFERTKYSNASYATYGLWTESPSATNSYYVWSAYSFYRYVVGSIARGETLGVRPAIELSKSKIQ